jgi:hypothetical protein
LNICASAACIFLAGDGQGDGVSTLCSGAGGVVLIGTLCAGAGISGVGPGHAVARFKIWAIWIHALVMVEP